MARVATRRRLFALCVLIAAAASGPARGAAPEPAGSQKPNAPLKVLFLGDRGHHRPADRARILTPALAPRGISVEYTEDVRDLDRARLAGYHALLVYANIDAITPDQEQALLGFVEGGGGLVAVHCGLYCFRNSDRYVSLVGGRFKSHGEGGFRARVVDAQHPVTRGVRSYEGWDESYVHDRLADDLRVLMVRDHDGGVEPYTWVRQQGRGRVFYTALGHDGRAWNRAEFQGLIEGGIRWAAGADEPSTPAVAAGAAGTRPGGVPAPLSPEESMRRMHLPEGLRVELFAAEPMIRNPLATAFDERGRLWVLESQDYPNNVLPGSVGNDTVRVLEDTDGDGRADKATVFADKLNIPTAIAFGGGGVIVGNTPDILLLRDTDGDGVADERKVLYTGFARNDTHFEMNNFWYGPDNWIWGALGNAGATVRVGDRVSRMSRGFFRFRPDGSAFEVLTTTSNNTYGLGFTRAGDVLGSTANVDHSWYMAIPNRHFERVRGWHGTGSAANADHSKSHPLVRPARQWDHAGGYTSAANAAVYAADRMPPEYRDRALMVCEPTINLIHLDLLVPQGSHLVSRDGWNLMASDDPWCGPVSAQVGPDGAVWVLDMYSYTMLHSKPDEPPEKHGRGHAWLTAVRDTERARVYRLVWDKAGSGGVRRLDRNDPDALVAALGDANMFWRTTAQRLLVERGNPDVLPRLEALVARGANPRAALHALRTMQGLGAFADPAAAGGPALTAALRHPDAAVRRAALDALPRSAEAVAQILSAGLVDGADAFVRRDALLALAEMPPAAPAAAAALDALRDPRDAADRWIPLAATAAAAANDRAFLSAATAGGHAAGRPGTALLAAVRVVATHYAQGNPRGSVVGVVAEAAGADPAIATAALDGLATGWRAGGRAVQFTEDEVARLRRAMAAVPAEAQGRLVALSERWGRGDLFAAERAAAVARLLAAAADGTLAPPARVDAARLALQLADAPEVADRLIGTLDAQAPPAYATGALDALAQCRQERVGAALVARWGRLTPALRGAAAAVLLRRPAWTAALLSGLESGKVDRAELSPQQRQQLTLNADEAVAARAKRALAATGAELAPDRKAVLDRLLPVTRARGDAALGRKVFEKNCAACHSHNGAGGRVGPDLSGAAARDKAELLVDIVEPNRSVELNYRLWLLETKGGETLAGRLDGETQTAVELLDGTGARHVVRRDEIVRLVSRPESAMPQGFESLPPEDLTNLLEFLTLRGRFRPLPLDGAATAASTRAMWQAGNPPHERMVPADWGTKTVAGVPFRLVDPKGGSAKNLIVLHSPRGAVAAEMPKSVTVRCDGPARAVHLLSGVSGWGFPSIREPTVSMIVRLHYADGKIEDHPLVNGEHFADFARRVEVPQSQFAFEMTGRQQVRYLAIRPARADPLTSLEFVKGPDQTSPVVMAVTVEAPDLEGGKP